MTTRFDWPLKVIVFNTNDIWRQRYELIKQPRDFRVHTCTSLVRESDSARVPMSQTPPCVGRKVGSQLVKLIRARLPSQVRRAGHASQIRTCMGPFTYRCASSLRDTSEVWWDVLYPKLSLLSDWPLHRNKRRNWRCSEKRHPIKPCRPTSLVSVEAAEIWISF
jgi:hypothetical protein